MIIETIENKEAIDFINEMIVKIELKLLKIKNSKEEIMTEFQFKRKEKIIKKLESRVSYLKKCSALAL